MKKLAICDLDGTLVDSRADLTDAINLTRAVFSLPPFDIDTVTSFVGNGAEKLIERAFSGHDIDFKKALHEFKRFYSRNICVKTVLYPTVKEGLQTLKDNDIAIAVISNKPTKQCFEVLEALSVRKDFDVVFGGDCHPLKPNPESIYEAIKITGANKPHSCLIGDSAVDAQAAKNAGIKSYYARYGFFHPDESLFNYAVDSFIEFCHKFISADIKDK